MLRNLFPKHINTRLGFEFPYQKKRMEFWKNSSYDYFSCYQDKERLLTHHSNELSQKIKRTCK